MIVITSDTEWSSLPVIEYMTDILAEYALKITFFCTDKRDTAIRGGHDLALHPNFKTAKDDDERRKTVQGLLQLFPRAVGVRSHSTGFDTTLIPLYLSCGLKYDSTYLIPRKMRPFRIFGLLEIPIWWMDNQAFTSQPERFSSRFLEEKMRQGARHTKGYPCVLNFHPVHVYLNTESHERYLKAKPHYQDPEHLLGLRNRESAGTEDCFRTVLDCVRKFDLETCAMNQLLHD